MLPNDNILNEVADKLLRSDDKPFTHISCSTISPKTSRYWAKEYEKNNMTFIAAPVFARPDGIIARKASWLISGEEKGRKTASSLLQSSGNVFQFGDDVGAANVVKIVGNFLIAVSFLSLIVLMK
jgi:3-hydroxyisobutyrate dehydrogenase-like beta-hydroxyacid dehydrogenase